MSPDTFATRTITAYGPHRAGVTATLLATVLLIGLSHVHFLWFHSLAELFAIIVGISVYLIAHNSYVFTRNAFLLFLAQGFFWAACVDTSCSVWSV